MRRAQAAALFVCLAALTLSLGPASNVTGAGPNRAALVVRSGDGEVNRMCVFFEEDEITGFDLLDRSGLDLIVDANSLGTAVCQIEGEGCGGDDCFCRYPTFWGYWVPDADGKWSFSDSGASDRAVKDGDINGWSWGRDGKPTPPKLAFDDVCTADSKPSGETQAATQRTTAPRQTSSTNLVQFAGFAALLAAAGVAAYALRLRRRRP